MSRRKQPRPLIPTATAGRILLNRVADAVLESKKASWDDRILAAIMLVSVDCDEEQARGALQPTYDFYGRAEFGSSDGGSEGDASFARGTVELAARRLQEARSAAKWEREENARLRKRKSKLRVIAGGQF
jgi:hypothetical protein